MGKQYSIHAGTIAALKQELHELQTSRMEEIEKMLADAKALGDLSENLEYEFARDELDRCLERIEYIKQILSHAVVADEAQQK